MISARTRDQEEVLPFPDIDEVLCRTKKNLTTDTTEDGPSAREGRHHVSHSMGFPYKKLAGQEGLEPPTC